MKVAVIGAGASGLISAGFCAKNGNEVLVFDSNEKAGKKIYITGKGRCNLTNNVSEKEFLENVVNNSKFLYGAIYSFSPQKTMEFFENLGLKLKVERGNRVFPESDKASDVTKMLLKNCDDNVSFKFNEKVLDIKKDKEKFIITTSCGVYNDIDSTIICSGGKSYTATGSDGFGYVLASRLGHNIIKPKPALVPILLNDSYVKDIEGLSLKNVTLYAKNNNKIVKQLFGEMMFTKNGITGPIVLSMSSYINTLDSIELYIDFKPALDELTLDTRLIKEINDNSKIMLKNLLINLLPKNFVPIFLKISQLNPDCITGMITVSQRKTIIKFLKQFPINFAGLEKLEFGIITSGGIDVKEINPKTMESKLVKGLYFAGEILDVDALTGGFNLQIAFSTGYVAGNSIK